MTQQMAFTSEQMKKTKILRGVRATLLLLNILCSLQLNNLRHDEYKCQTNTNKKQEENIPTFTKV